MQATSPYIFPFRPFRHLNRSVETVEFTGSKTVDESYFKPIIAVLAPRLEVPAGGALEDRLLELFVDPRVVFGDPEFIRSRAGEWKQGFRDIIARGKPMLFSILGFPYKMPVPLKTNRRLADFGEVASLARLNEIGKAIAKVYSPGVKIHVFTEGPFSQLNGMPRELADQYFESLQGMVDRFGLGEHIVLQDLSRIIDEQPDFNDAWKQVTEEIRQRQDRGDPKTLEAIRDALPVRFHNIANPGVSEDELRRAYLSDESAASLRTSIQARAEEGVLRYRAFLEARDRINLLERYAPGALAMTVSPRPGRLGVRPLPAPADVLPYHGVPVWDSQQQILEIEYLWDLTRGNGRYERIYLAGDPEDKPFLYVRS
ncbi:L-tyrosine/L-tryptophan isonitrile synthase family protein [Microvirga sp. G4-2]|uniref:L-tyrosine/L-tryptophan isonitrile synthase family protein n=1 Tax=Microvirga sp. G4-2 TaxID=3434467 RepID=UPI00404440F8